MALFVDQGADSVYLVNQEFTTIFEDFCRYHVIWSWGFVVFESFYGSDCFVLGDWCRGDLLKRLRWRWMVRGARAAALVVQQSLEIGAPLFDDVVIIRW
jgi:hypothetical protein